MCVWRGKAISFYGWEKEPPPFWLRHKVLISSATCCHHFVKKIPMKVHCEYFSRILMKWKAILAKKTGDFRWISALTDVRKWWSFPSSFFGQSTIPWGASILAGAVTKNQPRNVSFSPTRARESVRVCACHRPLAMILSVSGFDDPCKAHPSRPYHIAWVPGKSSLCLNVKNTCHPGNQNPSELDDARIALLVGWLGSWEKKIKPKPVKDANPF